MSIIPLSQIADDRVEALLDEAFGADRYNRTAYKIRTGADVIDDLSIAYVEGDRLAGTLQCWPVSLVGDDATEHQLIMVGPVAVVPERQNQGIGIALMTEAMALHDARPEERQLPMVMIGDAPYYGRWDFSAASTQGWRVPGPVERDRLLLRWLSPADLPTDARLGPES